MSTCGNHLIFITLPLIRVFHYNININCRANFEVSKRTGMTDCDVGKGLQNVLERVSAASLRRPKELQYVQPRLVAVSKTKPVEMIISAYEQGQRHFGENYIQELTDKSNDPQILENCKDICWHYIGHLQRNKVNKIVTLPRLFMLETVDSEKIASSVNSAWGRLHEGDDQLKIMIQINTSGEKEKSGVMPTEASGLAKFVIDSCPNLNLIGFMTIGQYGYDVSKGPNPDFLNLVSCRENICQTLGIPKEKFELSMGMSDDFEHAIELGSTNVRVGSSIFGFRAKKPPASISEGEDGGL